MVKECVYSQEAVCALLRISCSKSTVAIVKVECYCEIVCIFCRGSVCNARGYPAVKVL